MNDRVFIDSNLWIYLYSSGSKSTPIQQIIDRHFNHVVLSSQVVGELFHVLTRKNIKSKTDAAAIVHNLQETFKVVEVSSSTVSRAIDINIRYGYSYWDSQIIASALALKCSMLYSEDMQHQQVIDKHLTITNPFK